MDANFKRSLFIERLIPQYIREEYPLFVSFLKEYYSYLDAKSGQLIAVKILDGGRAYTSPVATIYLVDNNPDSATYGQYIVDFKGASLTPYVVNGILDKIVVTNYGGGYVLEDAPKIVISDLSGSGAQTEAVIVGSPGGLNQTVKEISGARDIDNQIAIFVEFLKNEAIPNLPKKLYDTKVASVEATKFVKFIKQFYNSTGVENSIAFLYRILFNADVSFYYPKVDMLRTSAGKWQVDNVLRIFPAPDNITDFKSQYVGSRLLITGATGAATAILENAYLSLVPGLIGATGPHALLHLSTLNGVIDPAGGQAVFNYPITGATGFLGNTFADGSTGAFYSENGRYIGDDGQLDSTKRIQGSPNIPYGASGALPYYYQDFSYELQSTESIKSYKGLLEEIIHPAGLIYFIRLNLERAAAFGLKVSNITDVFIGADKYFASEVIYSGGATGLSFICNSLGPTFLDIDKAKEDVTPQPYLDFSGSISGLTPSTVYSTIDISNSSYWNTNTNEFTNYSVVIVDGSSVYYRWITSYNPTTAIATLNASFTTGGSSTSVNYRIIGNYRFSSISGSTVGLSTLDPYHYIPYSPIPVTTLAIGATGSAGATGISLATSDDLNVKVGDVLRIDSEDVLVNWIVGATGVRNISVTRGYNSTTPGNHTPGATAFNKTDHRFRNWRIYVTSGPGSGQFSKVVSYGATGIIGFSTAYTFNSGSTGPNVNSTYWLVPDFAGATGSLNDGYYTVGSTGISDITISHGGVGYSGGATGVYVQVTIDPPPYGTQATATATVGATGAITSINITNYGSGYLFTPLVSFTQIGATSPTSVGYAYANIQNTNSPSSQVTNYNLMAGRILSVSDARTKFDTAHAVANLDVANGTQVFSCTIINGGKGYIKTPRISFRKGGGSGAAAYAVLTGGSISSVVMTSLGQDYSEPPYVYFDDSIIEPGERIYQSSTGALGTVEYWDRDSNLLYIYKDPTSPEFDLSQITYNGINILVDSVAGLYNTSGKRTNVLPESEITVI